MAKGVLGGMTDYRHQSLDDIIQDLRNERENTIAFKRNIKENLAKATESHYWEKNVSSDFRIIVHYALTFYETVVSEIDDIIQDLEQTISDHHIKRLNHIGIIASKLNRDIGQIWHTKYPNKQYGNPHFLIIERIYGNTRDMAVNLLDFQNIAERLEDFKGRNKMVKQNNPWISGSFYLFVFLAIITAIAVLLNVLDWKIIPIVLIIGIISITIIGLLQLKNDRIITDHTFLESLREILNRIPLLKSILSDKSK